MKDGKTMASAMLAAILMGTLAHGQNIPGPVSGPVSSPVTGAGAGSGAGVSTVEQRLDQMHAAQARNTQQLHRYQWLESMTVTVNGHQAPPRQTLVRYAADGSMLRTPVASGAAPQMRGGPLRRHIMENKMEEAKSEVEEVGNLVHAYLPPTPERLQETIRSGRISIDHDPVQGLSLVLHDYAKPGDQLRLTLDQATMQIVRIDVISYFEKPKDALTATVRFANLLDGTMYPAVTTVEAPGKKVNMTTTNADYVRIAQ